MISLLLFKNWCENDTDLESLHAVRLSKHGRASGGIVSFVHPSLKGCVTRIDKAFSFAVIGKMRSDLFCLILDIILFCCYIPPEGSRRYISLDERNGLEIVRKVVIVKRKVS